jgi:hypothetical protein
MAPRSTASLKALRVIPLGVAYAIWGGVGIVLTMLVGIVVFKQQPDLPAVIGATLIILGVVAWAPPPRCVSGCRIGTSGRREPYTTYMVPILGVLHETVNHSHQTTASRSELRRIAAPHRCGFVAIPCVQSASATLHCDRASMLVPRKGRF